MLSDLQNTSRLVLIWTSTDLDGSVIVNTVLSLQLLASVIVTLYEPAARVWATLFPMPDRLEEETSQSKEYPDFPPIPSKYSDPVLSPLQRTFKVVSLNWGTSNVSMSIVSILIQAFASVMLT